MSTIVTRAGKGSPLTHNEVDANFTNLNTDKIQSGNTVAALTITSATISGGTITGITDLAIADGGTGASTAADARTNLGVAIGTNVQAYDSNLTSFVNTFTLPTTDGTANQVLKTDGAGTLSLGTINTGDAYVGSTNTFTANQIISVTDNTNAALRVTQLGTGDAIRVEDATNPDSTPFIVKADGKVGIGIATPSYELEVSAAEPVSRVYGTNANLSSAVHISNASNQMIIGKDRNGSSGYFGSNGEYFIGCNGAFPLNFHTNSTKALTVTAAQDLFTGTTDTAGSVGQLDALRIIGTSGPKASIAQFRYTNDNGAPNTCHYKSRGTSVGSFTAVQNADNIASMQGYASDGTAWINSASIVFTVGNTVSAGIVPSNIVFNTTNSVGSQTTQAAVLYTGNLQFNSGYGSVATAYGCRAWVNFNGTGTVAIRASGNVSSITDVATGQYRVNFTTAMPDANYSAVSMSGDGSAGTVCFIDENQAVPTASAINIRTAGNAATANVDTAFISVAIFR